MHTFRSFSVLHFKRLPSDCLLPPRFRARDLTPMKSIRELLIAKLILFRNEECKALPLGYVWVLQTSQPSRPFNDFTECWRRANPVYFSHLYILHVFLCSPARSGSIREADCLAFCLTDNSDVHIQTRKLLISSVMGNVVRHSVKTEAFACLSVCLFASTLFCLAIRCNAEWLKKSKLIIMTINVG